MKYFIIALFLIISSCSYKTEKLEIDLQKASDCISVNELADSIENIQLETLPESVIGRIDNIIKVDSFLFVKDRRQKSIFCFNLKGKFINKINEVGRGPGEYITISSFCVDTEKSKIYILDDNQQKIIRYNYNFEFESELKYPNSSIIRSIAILPNGNFLLFTPDCLNGRARDGIWEIDIQGNFVKEHVTADPKFKLNWGSDPNYSLCGTKLGYFNYYTNEIFQYGNGLLNLETAINLKQQMPINILNNNKPDPKNITKRYFINTVFSQTKKYYFLKYFSSENGVVNVTINKSSKQVKMFKSVKVDQTENILLSGRHNIFSYDGAAIVVPSWESTECNPILKLIYLK